VKRNQEREEPEASAGTVISAKAEIAPAFAALPHPFLIFGSTKNE